MKQSKKTERTLQNTLSSIWSGISQARSNQKRLKVNAVVVAEVQWLFEIVHEAIKKRLKELLALISRIKRDVEACRKQSKKTERELPLSSSYWPPSLPWPLRRADILSKRIHRLLDAIYMETGGLSLSIEELAKYL